MIVKKAWNTNDRPMPLFFWRYKKQSTRDSKSLSCKKKKKKKREKKGRQKDMRIKEAATPKVRQTFVNNEKRMDYQNLNTFSHLCKIMGFPPIRS